MNGGVEVASTNCCDAASSTTGRVVVRAMLQLPRGRCGWLRRQGRARRRRPGGSGRGLSRGGDRSRMRGVGKLDRAVGVGTLGHVALYRRGEVLAPPPDEE